MKLHALYHDYTDRFEEAREDIPWSAVTKALDEGDDLLAARLIRDPLEAMAEAVEDEKFFDDVDDKVDRILQSEIEDQHETR